VEAFDECNISVFYKHGYFNIDSLVHIHKKGDHKSFYPFVLSRFCGIVDRIYFLDIFQGNWRSFGTVLCSKIFNSTYIFIVINSCVLFSKKDIEMYLRVLTSEK
jgi:hypothetical protein